MKFNSSILINDKLYDDIMKNDKLNDNKLKYIIVNN